MVDLGVPFAWTDAPGHLSYVLIAVSYWLTNFFWLRVMAVIGLSLEIVYFQLSGGALQAGIGWDIVFILINLFQIYRLVKEHRRVRGLADLSLLNQGAFAGLNPLQLGRLTKAGTWQAFEPGAELTREGEPVTNLILICAGQVSVVSGGRVVTRLHGGSLIGELAFISGETASATVVVEEPTRAFVIEMERLRRLIRADDLIASAVDRVVGRDLAAKLTAETRARVAQS